MSTAADAAIRGAVESAGGVRLAIARNCRQLRVGVWFADMRQVSLSLALAASNSLAAIASTKCCNQQHMLSRPSIASLSENAHMALLFAVHRCYIAAYMLYVVLHVLSE
jgi:hypothetical protein